MKKLVFSTVILLFVGLSMQAQNRTFVDLGLSSGTKWCTKNESGLWSLDDAKNSFSSKLPSIEQFSELIAECEWTWTGAGYRVKGSNGNSIYLPADGSTVSGLHNDCYMFDHSKSRGQYGIYWSSEPAQKTNCDYANYGYNGYYYTTTIFEFSSNGYGCKTDQPHGYSDCGNVNYRYSVRLVQ